MPCLFSLMAVCRVVAFDEIRQIVKPHRFLLQHVVDVGAVVLLGLLRPAQQKIC
jgi:hypothetical protein